MTSGFGPETSRAEALDRAARQLDSAGLSDARSDARILLCAAAGIDRAALLTRPEAPLGPETAVTFSRLLERRLAREPVSRILGRRAFWRFDLLVTPDVLDPRPDTETVVEAALTWARDRRGDALRVLDLGTGSGAILCAVLSELPAATGWGLDRCSAACRVAAANLAASGFGDRSLIVNGDWGAALIPGAFDLIVSNPPYIERDAIRSLDPEVRIFDPRAALDGGVDGLDAYRIIAPQAAALLAPGGAVFTEIGFAQAAAVAGLLDLAGLQPLGTRRDLAGTERVVGALRSHCSRR